MPKEEAYPRPVFLMLKQCPLLRVRHLHNEVGKHYMEENGLTPVHGNKIGERKLVLDFRFVLIGFTKWLDYNNSNGAQCTKISRLLV